MWQNFTYFITILCIFYALVLQLGFYVQDRKKTYSEYEKIPIKNDEN